MIWVLALLGFLLLVALIDSQRDEIQDLRDEVKRLADIIEGENIEDMPWRVSIRSADDVQ